jgi:PAS domain S-box-containing protein
MPVMRHPLLTSYGIATVGVILAGLKSLWFGPLVGNTPPVRLLLVIVVTVSAGLGGLGPGLYATALGLVAIVAGNDAPGDWPTLFTRLSRFGSLALLITGLFHGLHVSCRRAATREGQFRLSEGRYRRLVETASEGIWATDGDGRTTYANPRLGEMLGTSPARMIGRPLREFLVDTGDAPAGWPDALACQTVRCEVHLRGDDGVTRHAIVTARPVGSDEVPGDGLSAPPGAPGGLLLMVTDITLRKQAEEALRSERDFSSAVLETAGNLVVVVDREGRVVRFNRACRETTGYETEEVLGRPFWDLFLTAGEAGAVRSVFDRLLDGDGPLRYENHWSTKQGALRLIAWSNTILVDPGGQVGFVIGTGTDITDLRRAEEALREKESVLHSFYESSSMAMGVVELIGDDIRFVSANTLADRGFGLSRGRLEGMTVRELGMPPDRLATWTKRLRACRETGRPIHYETRGLWPTCPQWVAVTLSAMGPPASGQALCRQVPNRPCFPITAMGPPASGHALCSFIVEDVTDRRRTEEALRVTKEAAEKANQSKDRFLAVLSHELRTPLTPVLFSVSSLLESDPAPSLRPILEMIRRNIELEARLIDDLLDLSRIARGRLRLDMEVLDMHQAIQSAVEICRDETLVTGLDVVTDLQAPRHHVMADHARVMQIGWNLIHNAAKFTPPGGRLIIRTTNLPGSSGPAEPTGEGGRPRLVVEFADTGMGIDPVTSQKHRAGWHPSW